MNDHDWVLMGTSLFAAAGWMSSAWHAWRVSAYERRDKLFFHPDDIPYHKMNKQHWIEFARRLRCRMDTINVEAQKLYLRNNMLLRSNLMSQKAIDALSEQITYLNERLEREKKKNEEQ